MNRLFPLIALFATASVASAQIQSGHYTDGNGTVARVEVTPTDAGLRVTVTSSGGFTSAVPPVECPHGVLAFGGPEGVANPGGQRFKGANHKVWVWNGEGWVCMRRIRSPAPGAQQAPPSYSGGGPGIPPKPPPPSGMYLPLSGGDEVGSLPDPGYGIIQGH